MDLSQRKMRSPFFHVPPQIVRIELDKAPCMGRIGGKSTVRKAQVTIVYGVGWIIHVDVTLVCRSQATFLEEALRGLGEHRASGTVRQSAVNSDVATRSRDRGIVPARV